MAKLAFFCIPAYGHTNPTLEVVRELTKCGHQVIYFSFSAFQKRIEEAGAQFVSCDAYLQTENADPERIKQMTNDVGASIKLLADTT